jgi:hypothetical protein
VKTNMKVIFVIIVFGAGLLSSIGALTQPGPASPARGGGPETNQVAAVSQLQRLRRRLGERNVDLSSLLKRDEWEKSLRAPDGAAPTFTVEDGAYQLIAPPPVQGQPPQFSTAGADLVDSSPPPPRVHIAFSYPAAFQTLAEPGASIDSAGSPVANLAMAPPVFDRAAAAAAADTSAWADGVSKTAAESDDYIPAEAPLRTAPKPNVIIPEPNELVLFAMFGGALLLFSNRRANTRRAA